MRKRSICSKIKKFPQSVLQTSRAKTKQALNVLIKSIKDSGYTADEMQAVLIELRHSMMKYQKISKTLIDNETFLHGVLNKSSDIVFRRFQVGNNQAALIIFVDGLTDNELVNNDIVKPLIRYRDNISKGDKISEILQNQVITSAKLTGATTHQDVVKGILAGDVAILIDGMGEALIASMRFFDKRNVEEPQIESAIRAPREGFTESLRTNTSLVRRRLKTPNLKTELLEVGRLSKTDVILIYLAGIASDALIEETRRRISQIDIDAILASGTIEELIEDNSLSIFPQFGYTERPDKLASGLLEGQVGIMVDNTPFVLLAPQTFFRTMQAPDDYYERALGMSFIRLIRYSFLFIALLMPAVYIALSTFHQGMIPTTLLLSMAASRENIPFPAFIEAMIMEIFFEGLREAGVRLPRPVGQTVSIVGALVIGQAAMQAGIVSAPMVITVSLTGIASFTIPRFNQAIAVRVLRFILMILAGTLGLYGVFMGVMFILIHMASLRSLGVPYLSPMAPLELSALKDVFIRVPWWAMITRPGFTGSQDIKRMKVTMRPRPPQ